MVTAPAHKAQKRPTIPTCFCAFMVSHTRLRTSAAFIFLPVFLLPHLYLERPGISKGILSVTFADRVAIPVGNLHQQILGAIWNALAAEAAVWSKAWREAELFVFGVGHLRNGFESFAHNAVTGRARANAAARMVDFNAVRQGNVENTARKASVAVGDL